MRASDRRQHREFGPYWTGGAVAQLLATALWLPQAGLIAAAIQRMADGKDWQALWPLAIGVLVIGVLRAGLEAWGLRRVFVQARRQLSRLRADLAATLALRSPIDIQRPSSGMASSLVGEQIDAVLPWLTRYQPVRLRVLAVPVLIVLAVAGFSWAAAVVLVVAAPLIPLFMAIVGWRAQTASEAQMIQMGQMNGFLLDRLRGLASLRALGAVDATATRLRAAAEDLRGRTMVVLRIAFLSSAVLELFSALGVAMVAVYVGFHLLGHLNFGVWGDALTLGQGLFILLLAPAFFEPLRDLAAVWHDRAAGEAALEALDQVRRHGKALPAHQGSMRAIPIAGTDALSVCIRGLQFAPGAEARLFDRLDLDLHAGEHVALVGASGSGKSTLLSLLAGLAMPDAGHIHLGGTPLGGDTAEALRRRIAWMGQRPHVFAGSVAANVSLGRPTVSTARIDAALDFASLGELARTRASSTLGEGGVGLSGGEAVRLALARLAVSDNTGLLLVDEPTAHLDGETAVQVADALVQLARGRTLIVATHDPRVIARMQRVVSLSSLGRLEAA